AVNKKIPEILTKFPAKEFNIVIMSLSGGTGSTVGALLAKQLMQSGKKVIILGMVSTNTMLEIENATDTLGNLEKISTGTSRPV
ncbi:hypothetical protein ACXWO4_10520, partial [Streptococcus pyogenes]